MTERKKLVPTLLPQIPVVESPEHSSDVLPAGERIVYGDIGDALVFIPKRRAEELAAVRAALDSASTWGELRARLRACSEEAYEFVAEVGEGVQDDEEFSTNQIGAYGDGDFPAWPKQEMLAWMPQDVIELGGVDLSVFNGEFLHYEPSDEDDIVAALEAHGYVVEPDDRLVAHASGW